MQCRIRLTRLKPRGQTRAGAHQKQDMGDAKEASMGQDANRMISIRVISKDPVVGAELRN